jgi:putative ABC transport system permease protein
MILLEVLAVALKAIRVNGLRSILTALGIIIGVAAVIAMIGLGEGAQQAVQQQIAAMGTNLLFIRPGSERVMGVAQGEKPLTPEDAEALRAGATALAAVVPEMTRSFQVEYANANPVSSIVGTTPEYPAVQNYQLAAGRFFDGSDLEGRRRVAVLGSEVLRNLGLAAGEILGQSVKIGGMNFEVIGSLAEKGQVSYFNPDDQILVPLTTARFRLVGSDRLRSITVQVDSPERIPLAMAEIDRILRRTHRIREGMAADFSLRDQSELRRTFESTTRVFSILLASIAAVSLVVGGIGIMNIMLVSVTERTREIGLRKAVGATARQILLQFLTEALVLCLLGGALGVLVGAGFAWLMAHYAGWSVIVARQGVALALGFAGATGLFFGLYPAARASALDPIEALRYE